MALLPSFSRDTRRFACLAACGVALLALLPPPVAAQEGTTLRSVAIPGFGTLRFPAPTDWRSGSVKTVEAPADGTDGAIERAVSFQVTPDGDSHAEMNVSFSWSEMPDPAFNGPAALRALVERMGRAALDESIEAHCTLHEMRSPRGGGYWFTLRARAPRKKSQAYLTSGAFGLGNALLRFTFLAPQPDLPEAAEAIALITGARIDDEPSPAP
jgi:hypothetical protein